MSLIGYARFYQQIHELPLSERPPDDVIEDDAALDQWWERFIREMYRKAAKPMAVSGDVNVMIPQFDG